MYTPKSTTSESLQEQILHRFSKNQRCASNSGCKSLSSSRCKNFQLSTSMFLRGTATAGKKTYQHTSKGTSIQVEVRYMEDTSQKIISWMPTPVMIQTCVFYFLTVTVWLIIAVDGSQILKGMEIKYQPQLVSMISSFHHPGTPKKRFHSNHFRG